MCDDAYASGGAADRSVEYMRAPQVPRCLALAFGAELEAAGAPDNRDIRPARQPPDDFLADAVGEVLQLRVARKIVEGQDCDDALRQGGIARRGFCSLGFAAGLGCLVLARTRRAEVAVD